MPGLVASLRVIPAALAAILAVAILTTPAAAQLPAPPAKPAMTEFCPGMIAATPPLLVPAAYRPVALAPQDVRITYVGHSTFLLESPQHVRTATDYNDYVKPSVLPDVVTMNHAHSTHYTDFPDPAIKYVLRGWGPSPDQPARHDVQVKDVHIRNVPTNIRNWSGGTERHGNSIFVFEIGSLCVAHLGHLHHTLNQQQLNEIGKVDVVLVPVDGGMTLDLDGMVEVLDSLKPQLMIPMHFFSTFTLDRFIAKVKDKYTIEYGEVPTVVVSKASLPTKPKLLVLRGH